MVGSQILYYVWVCGVCPGPWDAYNNILDRSPRSSPAFQGKVPHFRGGGGSQFQGSAQKLQNVTPVPWTQFVEWEKLNSWEPRRAMGYTCGAPPGSKDALEGGLPPGHSTYAQPATVSLTPSASFNGICNRQ